MALIPLEEHGAPSQKTSLSGGVAQILIYSRPYPCLDDMRLFIRTKSQHFICVFVIDVIFRSEKHWRSFDVGEQGSADDGHTDMWIATHERSPL